MENVIYSKFSCERKKQFQIVTKITEENNIRHIRKQALGKAGCAHVDSLADKMDMLKNSESYRNVSIVKSEIRSPGIVELEYIYGKTFEAVINDIAARGNRDGLIDEIKKFFNLFEVKTPFKYTEGFKEVFGDIELKDGYMCMDVSNIDLLFSNIILKDNRYYVSDYEWVFAFPVPFKYIEFRSIAFNVMISQLEKDSIDKIYESLDISREEIDMFYKMEINFQNYVSGIKLLDDYKKKSKTVVLPVNAIDIRKNVYTVQLLYNGTVSETKEFYRGDFLAEFYTDKFMDNITIRFGNGQAIIKIENITAYKNGAGYMPQFTANDDFHINENYYFKNENPEIYIADEGIERLQIQAVAYYTGTGLVGQYIDKIFEANEITSKLNEANNSLTAANLDKEELLRINGNLRQEIDYLHSKTWFKIYFKLKSMKDKLLRK